MSTIHTTSVWGSWSGGQTVTTEPAPCPQANVTLVDPTDPQAVADWTAGIPARLPLPGEVRITSPLLLAARRAALDIEADDDGTAESTDPMED